jgi:hypothetical protein
MPGHRQLSQCAIYDQDVLLVFLAITQDEHKFLFQKKLSEMVMLSQKLKNGCAK